MQILMLEHNGWIPTIRTYLYSYTSTQSQVSTSIWLHSLRQLSALMAGLRNGVTGYTVIIIIMLKGTRCLASLD